VYCIEKHLATHGCHPNFCQLATLFISFDADHSIKNAGTNPATVSYNDSAVKYHRPTNSIARFLSKKYFLLL
jgi:hypothetical protein